MGSKDNWCVYMHTSPSGKIYIGITSQKPEYRWGENGKGYLKKNKNGDYHQPAMANAILKYGWDNFIHDILFEDLSREDAEHKEFLLILLWESNNSKYGYNIKNGGSTGKFPPETLKKKSNAIKGEKHPNYGKHRSEETKKKISNTLKGSVSPMKGKHHSEETKRKLSELLKGKYIEENNPMYGKTHTDEARKKMSEAKKGKPALNKRKAVLCLELNQQWDSVQDAQAELKIYHIGDAAKEKRNYAGTHPITGEPLHWKFI